MQNFAKYSPSCSGPEAFMSIHLRFFLDYSGLFFFHSPHPWIIREDRNKYHDGLYYERNEVAYFSLREKAKFIACFVCRRLKALAFLSS